MELRPNAAGYEIVLGPTYMWSSAEQTQQEVNVHTSVSPPFSSVAYCHLSESPHARKGEGQAALRMNTQRPAVSILGAGEPVSSSLSDRPICTNKPWQETTQNFTSWLRRPLSNQACVL